MRTDWVTGVPLSFGQSGEGEGSISETARIIEFDDDNQVRGDWLPYRANPWLRPPSATRGGSEGTNPDDVFVSRSRASLRQWMDENPY